MTNRAFCIAFDSVKSIIIQNGSFKDAVFAVENVLEGYALTKGAFFDKIDDLKLTSIAILKGTHAKEYYSRDSINFSKCHAIFCTMSDSCIFLNGSALSRRPCFTYNFDDPEGKSDWRNMFVTKLLTTHKGNCHSLVYLYKILADELGAKCWMSLAPNHIYIRNYSLKTGWYNIELTSNVFPTDAWIMATGYVSSTAIRSGLYMDTLSNQQSIALCMLDLAKEYEFQTHNYFDGFILKCCDLVLQYHSVNPQALLFKAETLQKVYLKQTNEQNPKAADTYKEMETAYITLAKLGYREMPEKMYQQWLQSLIIERDKYVNKDVPAKKE